MPKIGLTEVEARFAELIWNCEPISSGALVKLCETELSWKKSTTYTMLKRLEDKGLFANESGKVRALMRKDEYESEQSRQFVQDTFGGSLPKFLAAFTRSRKLNPREIEEFRRLIDEHKEEST
ncbi:BlaI/MecI/CopY family transcriptional regulator [Saccharibacillus sp. CPCC 101409]|uniref:BlaI/MecI/CopY family transcriptional regulator n=1 Tax=Saccharibacillus sp. CPCC 101409 TaxID=3058041 RepID=UPI0026713FDD|nr:BlaI/MecI/CopY family transcriptional regulator [Saccharibacillus sp. CPCC 101409]MDO3410381.1 BlaI/MecI/CopY family transcriptional regulator [Saccharibacillus sp. CPCC 101409]